VTAEKITVLPNATPPRAAAAPRPGAAMGPLHIVFLGQLGARKGAPQLIEALASLAGRGDWAATMAGDGEVVQCRERVKQLGLADRIAIPGQLDAPAAAQLLGGADIFTLPSFAENLPMAILEACAAGVPVVATPVGEIRDVIEDGRNGLLVEPGDVAGLAQALQRLLDDPALRQSLGAAARADHAERYSLKAYLPRLAAIWKRAASTRVQVLALEADRVPR
jgi:glycosyltransferase involved in cell wall biosynthesis